MFFHENHFIKKQIKCPLKKSFLKFIYGWGWVQV